MTLKKKKKSPLKIKISTHHAPATELPGYFWDMLTSSHLRTVSLAVPHAQDVLPTDICKDHSSASGLCWNGKFTEAIFNTLKSQTLPPQNILFPVSFFSITLLLFDIQYVVLWSLSSISPPESRLQEVRKLGLICSLQNLQYLKQCLLLLLPSHFSRVRLCATL